MLNSRFSPHHKSTGLDTFVEENTASLWNARVLWVCISVVLGMIFSIAAGALIGTERFIFLVPLGLLIPVTILFLKYPFVAVMIWVLVFPYFIATPTASGRFMFWMLHRAMIPSAVVVILVSSWLRIRKRRPAHFGRAELIMLIFLGVVLVNVLLLTPSPARSFIRYYDRLLVPFSMYLLVRLVAPTERDMARFLSIAFVTVIAQATIGLLGWFAPQVLPEQWLNRLGERTVGTFGNPAVYTTTLIFLSLLLFQYAMQGKVRWLRPVLLFAFVLTYICVFFSFSRGSWLGGSLVWIGLLFVYPKVMIRLTVVAAIIGLILAASMFTSYLGYANKRLNDADTAEGRILQNVAAINMIKAKPWFGWGFGTYDLYDEQHRTRVGDIAIRYREQTSHNTYLLITTEMGVIGLLLYLLPAGWWLMITKRVWRRLPRHGFQSWHLLAMLWLLILDHFVVSNFMDMIQANLFGTTIWWMTLGLIASLVSPHLKRGDIGVPRWATSHTGSV